MALLASAMLSLTAVGPVAAAEPSVPPSNQSTQQSDGPTNGPTAPPAASPTALPAPAPPAASPTAPPAPAQPAPPAPIQAEAVGAATPGEMQDLLRLLNAYRQTHGVPALALNAEVSASAQRWAMAQLDFPRAEPVPEAALPTGASYRQVAGTAYAAAGPTVQQLQGQLVSDYNSVDARTLREPSYAGIGIASIRSGLNLYVYEVLIEKPSQPYPTDYVHYAWSPAIYSVSYTATGMVWKHLGYSDWAAAGFPAPRIAGWIPGTRVFTFVPAPQIYATSADGVSHLLTYREWQDMDYRQPERAAGSFVKYPWSSSIYSVEFASPEWIWKRLNYDQWQQLGQPAPRIAGFIKGTSYYRHQRSSEIFASAEDGTLHKLTFQEWYDAGSPPPGGRASAFFKTAWMSTIYANANVNVEGSRAIGFPEWAAAGFPTPAIENFVPFSFYWRLANSGNIYYRTPDGSDVLMSFDQWQRAGTPWPRPYGSTPPKDER